jgi:hypothetical protein
VLGRGRARLLPAFVLAAAALVAAPAASAQAQAAPSALAGFAALHNYGNGKCADAALETLDSPTPKVQLWDCTGGIAHEQDWRMDVVSSPAGAFWLENGATHRCLYVPYDTSTQNYPLSLATCDAGSTLWRVLYANNAGKGWYQVVQNSRTGQCLTLDGNQSGNGTNLVQAACDLTFTSKAQQWQLP